MIAKTYRMVEHESGIVHIHRVTTNAKGEILSIAAMPVDIAGIDENEVMHMYHEVGKAFHHPVIIQSFLLKTNGKGS